MGRKMIETTEMLDTLEYIMETDKKHKYKVEVGENGLPFLETKIENKTIFITVNAYDENWLVISFNGIKMLMRAIEFKKFINGLDELTEI